MKNLVEVFESFLDKANKKNTQFEPESILTVYPKEFSGDSSDFKIVQMTIKDVEIKGKTLTINDRGLYSSVARIAQKYAGVDTLDRKGQYGDLEVDIVGDYPHLDGFTFPKSAKLLNHYTTKMDSLEVTNCDFMDGVVLYNGGVSSNAEFVLKNCKINNYFRVWPGRTYKFENCSGHVKKFDINTYADTYKDYKDKLVKQIKSIIKGSGKVEDLFPGLTADEVEIDIWKEKSRRTATNHNIVFTKKNPYEGRTRLDCMYNVPQPYKVGNWYVQWYSWKFSSRKRENKFPISLVKYVEPIQIPKSE